MKNWWEAQSDPVDSGHFWKSQSEPVAPAPPTTGARGTREKSPYIDRVSQAAGFPVSAESDLSVSERAGLGAADTVEERRAKWLKQYPQGSYQEIPVGNTTAAIYQRTPVDPVRLVDEIGVTPMDVLDRPQEMVTLPLQAGAAFLPGGLLAQLGIQAAIPGAVHLGKEAIEWMKGDQLQSAGEVAGTAAVESLSEAVAGGIPALFPALKRTMTRGRQGQAPEGLARDIEAIDALKAVGQDEARIPDPLTYQFSWNPIVQRIGAQMRSTSPRVQAMEAAQREEFSRLVSDYQTVKLGQAGATLEREGRKAMRRETKAIQRDFGLDRETAGKVVRGIFTEDFDKKSRSAINNAYEEAGRQADGVSFDLSQAQSVAKSVTAPIEATAAKVAQGQLVDLQGRPLTEELVEELVNVRADPAGAVRRVASLLDQIDPVQTDWRVVKALRTQVGDAIKEPRLSDEASGQAKAIYRALTNVMESPVGGNTAFVDAWRKANGLAARRFQIYQDGEVIRILANDSPADIAKAIGSSPERLNPVVREVIQDFAPEKRESVRNAVASVMLSGEGGARRSLQRWETDNKAAFDFLFPTRKEQTQIRQAAEAMDRLMAAPVADLLSAGTARINRGRQLLRGEGIGPSELEMTIRQLGGKQSPGGEAMRMAAFDDIIQQALTTGKDGMPALNGQALSKAIRDAQRSGVWEKVLTKEDKIKVRGLDAYVRVVFKNMMDTGTSLEQAQAIANLKHPGTFIEGMHALFVNNKVMPMLMLNPRTSKYFRPTRGKRGPKAPVRRDGGWVFAGVLANEIARMAAPEMDRDAEE